MPSSRKDPTEQHRIDILTLQTMLQPQQYLPIKTIGPIRSTESNFTFIGTEDSIFLTSLRGPPWDTCGPSELSDQSSLIATGGTEGPVLSSSKLINYRDEMTELLALSY